MDTKQPLQYFRTLRLLVFINPSFEHNLQGLLSFLAFRHLAAHKGHVHVYVVFPPAPGKGKDDSFGVRVRDVKGFLDSYISDGEISGEVLVTGEDIRYQDAGSLHMHLLDGTDARTFRRELAGGMVWDALFVSGGITDRAAEYLRGGLHGKPPAYVDGKLQRYTLNDDGATYTLQAAEAWPPAIVDRFGEVEGIAGAAADEPPAATTTFGKEWITGRSPNGLAKIRQRVAIAMLAIIGDLPSSTDKAANTRVVESRWRLLKAWGLNDIKTSQWAKALASIYCKDYLQDAADDIPKFRCVAICLTKYRQFVNAADKNKTSPYPHVPDGNDLKKLGFTTTVDKKVGRGLLSWVHPLQPLGLDPPTRDRAAGLLYAAVTEKSDGLLFAGPLILAVSMVNNLLLDA